MLQVGSWVYYTKKGRLLVGAAVRHVLRSIHVEQHHAQNRVRYDALEKNRFREPILSSVRHALH
jgi:hypothetical protein